MKHFHHKHLILLSALTVTGFACSHQNERLASLERSYLDAQADAELSRNAPVPLYETKKAIAKASRASEDEEIEHWIYIGEKRMDIARAVNGQRAADKTAKAMHDEREEILLSARERETRKAKSEAEFAQFERDEALRTAGQLENEAGKLRDENEQLNTQASKLESELAGLKVKETTRGWELTLQDTLFEFGKAELKPGATRKLDNIALVLQKNKDKEVLIEGHTDSVGSDTFNMNLSQRRAQAVKTYLTQRGLSSERIIAKGYGEAFPVASNTTSEGRQENRRVDVVIFPETTPQNEVLRN